MAVLKAGACVRTISKMFGGVAFEAVAMATTIIPAAIRPVPPMRCRLSDVGSAIPQGRKGVPRLVADIHYSLSGRFKQICSSSHSRLRAVSPVRPSSANTHTRVPPSVVLRPSARASRAPSNR